MGLDDKTLALAKSIRKGETTGDKVRDFVLARATWSSNSKDATERLARRLDGFERRMSLFEGGGVFSIIHEGDDPYQGRVFHLDSPVLDVADNFAHMRLRVSDGVYIRDINRLMLAPYLDAFDTLDTDISRLDDFTVLKGWDQISASGSYNAEELSLLLSHYEQSVPYTMQQDAEELRLQRVRRVLRDIHLHTVWNPALPTFNEQSLEETAADSSGRGKDHLTAIDASELNFDRKDYPKPHGRNYGKEDVLCDKLLHAVRLGLHNYVGIVKVQTRPGETIHIEVAKYIRDLVVDMKAYQDSRGPIKIDCGD